MENFKDYDPNDPQILVKEQERLRKQQEREEREAAEEAEAMKLLGSVDVELVNTTAMGTAVDTKKAKLLTKKATGDLKKGEEVEVRRALGSTMSTGSRLSDNLPGARAKPLKNLKAHTRVLEADKEAGEVYQDVQADGTLGEKA